MNDKIYSKDDNSTLTINGVGFTCPCGCEVFTKLELSQDAIQRYKCNICKSVYKTK